MELAQINWIAVVVAALSGFALGGVWYGPLFGKRWQGECGLSDEQIAEGNMGLIFGLTFILNLFVASFISLSLGVILSGGSSLATGALFGLFLSVAFVMPPVAVNYLFSRKSVPLFGIDIGFIVLNFLVMGAILGAWT